MHSNPEHHRLYRRGRETTQRHPLLLAPNPRPYLQTQPTSEISDRLHNQRRHLGGGSQVSSIRKTKNSLHLLSPQNTQTSRKTYSKRQPMPNGTHLRSSRFPPKTLCTATSLLHQRHHRFHQPHRNNTKTIKHRPSGNPGRHLPLHQHTEPGILRSSPFNPQPT